MMGAVAVDSMGVIKWKLKVVMAERNMSARKLEKLSKLSYGAIIKLRNGTPTQVSVKTLTALCSALECTPDDLLEFTEDEDESPK
jgi:putative transcriptional regulator